MELKLREAYDVPKNIIHLDLDDIILILGYMKTLLEVDWDLYNRDTSFLRDYDTKRHYGLCGILKRSLYVFLRYSPKTPIVLREIIDFKDSENRNKSHNSRCSEMTSFIDSTFRLGRIPHDIIPYFISIATGYNADVYKPYWWNKFNFKVRHKVIIDTLKYIKNEIKKEKEE